MPKLALASPWHVWAHSKVADPAVLAAALFADLATVDAFEEGDKSTAFLCAVASVEANGYSFIVPDSEATAARVRDFADRRVGENALAEWLRYWISR